MNELSSLLKRSIEGLGYGQSDFEDVAATVSWLEVHGLHGLEMVSAAWPRLTSGPGDQMQVIDRDEMLTTIDGGESSLLSTGHALVEFAVSVTTTSLSKIKCINVHDRPAIVSAMHKFSHSGFAALACWQERLRLHSTFIGIEDHWPDYRVATSEKEIGLSDNILLLACSNDEAQLRQLSSTLISESGANNDILETAANTFVERRHKALLDGIQMDASLHRILSASAGNVLVESTEQSRRGAGETE